MNGKVKFIAGMTFMSVIDGKNLEVFSFKAVGENK
jgi:hypothetical protein